jgi:type I restriction enzyme S subunit
MSEIKLLKLGEDFKCSFLSGFAFKSKDYVNKGIPIIKIGNIQGKRVSANLSVNYFSKDLVDDKIADYYLKDRDVLIAMTGQGSVGRVGKLILPSSEKALLNQRVGKFICDEINLNIDYLFYVLTTDLYQDYLFSAGTGSGQPNLSPEVILETEIPALPYNKQASTTR